MIKEKYLSSSPEETELIGKKLAERIKSGDIFLLNGELGAGKSVLIRGFAQGLGVRELLPSPTFTLVNEYQGKFKIYHFDLYRLNDPFELYEIGFEEYIYSDGVSFIEWPSKCGSLFPETGVTIDILIQNEEREIIVEWKK